MVTPIKKANLIEQVIQKIYEIIQDNQLKEGDKLPPERELAKILGVSRPSVREAIRVLNFIGFLKVKQGYGIVIETNRLSESLMKPLSFAFLLNKMMVLELFEARKIIEVECSGLAAVRATEEEIKEMYSIFESLKKSSNDREKSINYEIELHERIIDASRNEILKKILNSIKDLLKESRYNTVPLSGVSMDTIKKHSRLIKAIQERNVDKARGIMLEHLDSVSRRLEDKIKNYKKIKEEDIYGKQ